MLFLWCIKAGPEYKAAAEKMDGEVRIHYTSNIFQ